MAEQRRGVSVRKVTQGRRGERVYREMEIVGRKKQKDMGDREKETER